MKNSLGTHTLLELYNCNTEVLNNAKKLELHMKEAVIISGATIIDSNFHEFSPYGISGVIVIAESHFTIHTWPEHDYAAVDIFTCGNTINTSLAVQYLSKHLNVETYELKEFKRGFIQANGKLNTKASPLLLNSQTA